MMWAFDSDDYTGPTYVRLIFDETASDSNDPYLRYPPKVASTLQRQAERLARLYSELERIGEERYRRNLLREEQRVATEKVARRTFNQQARSLERAHAQRAAKAARRAPRHPHRFKGRR